MRRTSDHIRTGGTVHLPEPSDSEAAITSKSSLDLRYGMHTIDTSDGFSSIFLSRRDSANRAIHHEIWHAMEYRILCKFPDAFAAWSKMNPDGFEYKPDYFTTSEEEMDDWFAREYSKINEAEDRATVFDSIMVKDPQWWQTRPHLLQKARFILDAAKPVFGELFPGT